MKETQESVLRIRNLKKWFSTRKNFLEALFSGSEHYVKAVDGISFDVKKGEIFGLAGESGCGKTTTAKLILRLFEPTSGKVYYKGCDIFSVKGRKLKELRRRIQLIFQNPYKSLSDRLTVYDLVAEPFQIHKNAGNKEEMVLKTLEEVHLSPPHAFMEKYPHELSGGQRQRVSIARSLVMRPEVLVADEPVSMIDVSIRAGILNLLLELRKKYDITCIFITHDISVARYMCDQIGIMYLGKIVEKGAVEGIVNKPLHPYTNALMSVVPVPDPRARKRHRIILHGKIPSAVNVPPGCRFHTRCPDAQEICRKKEPKLVEVKRGHYVACHFVNEVAGSVK